MKAGDILDKAKELVGGNREQTHGNKLRNHENIAELWDAYLSRKDVMCEDPEGWNITALDVANMMELLKIARRLAGTHNPDDYIDGAGYSACAGEIAEEIRK